MRVDVDENCGSVQDKKYLKMVMDELIENSMSRGTSCIVDVKKNYDSILFRVCDNGPHTPDEKVHGVFQSYWMNV